MLYDHLDGGIVNVGGICKSEVYGDICIHIADSLCYTAETSNNVKQLYSKKDVKKIK